MDLKFYSDLTDGCPPSGEFLDRQTFVGYSEDNKFSESGDSYLSIDGPDHHFLSAEQTFHTPSLGDEVFEIPPISLDPDSVLSIEEAVSHFQLTDGSDSASGSSGSRSLVSNLVVGANDPSFASTFVNSRSQCLEQLSLDTVGQAGGGALLSSSALELGDSSASHFSSSSPMTIDVQLSDVGHGLLGSAHLSSINQSELTLGLSGENSDHSLGTHKQPLSATPSPVGSLHDEDVDDFRRSVLVDSPVSLSSSSVLSHVSSHPASSSSTSPAAVRRGGGKPAALAPANEALLAKKGRKKKDPNEPQKPVSAYALFFRDTQSAIKGQNPNASFGEVSTIVASMWDSLAEDQKQVYKKKTEAAKTEYLKALAAYKASQLSQPSTVEMEVPPSPAVLSPTVTPSTTHHIIVPQTNSCPDENPIANICASNIILNVPELTTRSCVGGSKAAPTAVTVPTTQAVTKIIIPNHILQAGRVVTLVSGGVHTLQPTLLVSSASRQPPPLQQMQNTPPPPRLQQMAPAPPPLQAKPREGSSLSGHGTTLAATPPPPLQIKIVPASIQDKEVVNSAMNSGTTDDDDVTEVLDSDEDVMEVCASDGGGAMRIVCVRAGCNKPAVESEDWDKEYCSNECVATHCSDVFKAWCSIRNKGP